MAAAVAEVSATVAPFSFRRQNLALSVSFFYPRFVLPTPRFAPFVARSIRFSTVLDKRHQCIVAAALAAGSPQFSAGENDSPYEILGISPVDGFDQVKMAYKQRRKDAECSGDAEYLWKLEWAYDRVMMEQLQNRKKGVAYGSIQVSKDIRYADNQPIVPWGPRYSRSTAKDLRINMAMSATFIMFTYTMGYVDWKPLQILCLAYFYRMLEKLKGTEPATTPVFNELIVTTASSVLLCILASYYR